MENLSRIIQILEAHQDKQFVQRILRPSEFPRKRFPGERFPSTHIMSWGTVGKDKKPIVYPEVIYDHRSGRLIRLSRESAWKHAVASGEFIPFDDPKEAAWFSEHYKDIWETPYKKAD